MAKKECIDCNGTGTCLMCDGYGRVKNDECPNCSGDGHCPSCDGYGNLEAREGRDG